MFTKFFKQLPSNGNHTKPLSFCNKRFHELTFEMKKFLFFKLSPMEMCLIDNRDYSKVIQPMSKLPQLELTSTRSFILFRGNLQSRNKEYQGKKLVGYSSAQMFDVVADVGKYEAFLPFCKKSHVIFRNPSHIKAKLVIGFPPLIESYTSNVTLVEPQLIKAVCTEGKIFHYLLTIWKFSPGLKNNANTCIIDFYVSFEFKSALHSHIANLFFDELVRQMESAFYQEAHVRYGEPVVPMQTLKVLQKTS